MVFLSFVAFFVALVAGLLVVRHARRHARRYARAAKPQRFHVGHTPRIGGVALFAGCAFGWAAGVAALYAGNRGLLNVTPAMALGWTVALLPALVGGIAEDLSQRMAVGNRMALTALSAGLAVWLLDVTLARTGIDWLDTLIAMPGAGAAMALAVLAVAGLPHAFNIIDGYNGLSGMVALVVCLALVFPTAAELSM